ncbi:MAG: PD-(D/E)XK motif protein [Glaciecola sp.]
MKLSDKWDILKSKDIISGINAIRFDSDSELELFLALDESNHRAVLLHLPESFSSMTEPLRNDNVELLLLDDTRCLMIRLLDPDFYGLFDDLVVSLYQSIKHLSDEVKASQVLIKTYIKWNVFFSKTSERSLSRDRILGLWGELDYLLMLCNGQNTSQQIDKLVKSWVGPFDATHDFELNAKSVEVKTKLLASQTVKISSEFQLELTETKPLELSVISVLESEFGLALLDLFTLLKQLILDNRADYTALLSALEKENLDEDRLSKYSHLKFIKKKHEVYNCSDEAFPKITDSKLPDAISGVKYRLNLHELTEYRIGQEIY